MIPAKGKEVQLIYRFGPYGVFSSYKCKLGVSDKMMFKQTSSPQRTGISISGITLLRMPDAIPVTS